MDTSHQFDGWTVLRYLAWLALAGSMLLAGCREDVPQKIKAGTMPSRPHGQKNGSIHQTLTDSSKRFLLVHSYHPEYPWVNSITEGIQQAIQGKGISLEVLYMDTKRHPGMDWAIQAGEKARTRLDEFKPDVVLAIDDDAQTYFAKRLVGGLVPVVFSGVDADPSKYGYPAENVTGIIERPHFIESIVLANRLRPIRKIAVMSAKDSTSVAALGFMKQENLPVQVEEWRMVDNFEEWRQAVLHFNETVDALVIRSYQAVPKPKSRDIEDPKVVAEWTAQHATIMTIAFHDFEIADGLLVGFVKSGQEYGKLAANYAMQIADGVSPGKLPIMRTRIGIPMINKDTCNRLGIPIAEDLLKEVVLVSRK